MFRALMFLAALVSALFIIQYSGSNYHIIISYGSEKVVLNLWFALLCFLLSYFVSHWLLNQLGRFFRLPAKWRSYQERKQRRDLEYSRGQALIYALAGDYAAASGHLVSNHSTSVLGDLILRATWLNQMGKVQEVDDILGKIQSLNAVPDGWMIWFRAYLMHQRGNQNLASDLLLDAIEAGIHSRQIIQSFVDYVDPQRHFQALKTHYTLLCRFVPQENVVELVVKAACVQLDQSVLEQAWGSVEMILQQLPKKAQSHPMIQFYKVKHLLACSEVAKALHLLAQVSFEDNRLIPVLASANIDHEQKLSLVTDALLRHPHHKDLMYLLSYLRAQGGDVDNTIKLLGDAITQD